jgi:ferredoxin-thioredoxin reductase catalytic chain
MLVNERRYGYWACPCRLATGVKSEDLDIICPCDYRDPDLAQYGTCYCALYVSQEVIDGKRKAARIPERRPADRMSAGAEKPPAEGTPSASHDLPDLSGLRYPLWRCRVCGYLCARDEPPEVCPICKAKKDRFERFL